MYEIEPRQVYFSLANDESNFIRISFVIQIYFVMKLIKEFV